MNEKIYRIALAGNPNVGKSTIFNALTGLHQHTGNWTGKTVETAMGTVKGSHGEVQLIDLPGTYSLLAHSAEEECARDYICFEKPDCTIVVCDASCLERNLNLVLQITEITDKVVVCVNLLDEAEKKSVKIDLASLEKQLGVPVVGTAARSNKGLDELIEAAETINSYRTKPTKPKYPQIINDAAGEIAQVLNLENADWIAHRLLENDECTKKRIKSMLTPEEYEKITALTHTLSDMLLRHNISLDALNDITVTSISLRASEIAKRTVAVENTDKLYRDRKIDNILVNKWTGIPVMFLLLAAIFWITIAGANYPSSFLMEQLFRLEDIIASFFISIGISDTITGLLVHGAYRTLAWVISVMLPPMAIFFPLFTILEDMGYLPRVAFNLDSAFKKANACGKQSLTTCMGFGCNAVGVTGCRIIDSPRERLIAILTNSFVPCNGRFPLIITVTGLFMITSVGWKKDILSAIVLALIIVFAIAVTLTMSKLLSKTVLKGMPSSFTLELPPYRMPQFGKVIVRSVLDRTIFVLGRAALVAFPAGIVIWLLANTYSGGASLLSICSDFLEPFGNILGLDGVILLAFILGFPANEIVIPIIIMCYTASGTLSDMNSLADLKLLLVNNGWTLLTAINTVILSLNHFPCSTTCLTIKKETKSVKWTLLAMLLPLAVGISLCLLTNLLSLCVGFIRTFF